ncbi:MAG: HEAT repeat domain-containing protein [Planctomycetota bacterium]
MIALSVCARADVIQLVGGGRVVGTIPEKQSRSTLTVQLEGGGRLTLDRDRVASISSESPAVREYRKRAPTAPDTVESQWALAVWCQQRKLKDEYRRHLNRVIELDPQHAEARALLGYQQHAGRWLTREQLMSARGMVRHDGDYRTRQEVAILERLKQRKETDAAWRSRLARWRRNLFHRDPERSAEAAQGFAELKDPAAGPELAKLLLGERDADAKRVLVAVAAQVRSGATVRALSRLALNDADEETRFVCLEHLARNQTPGLAEPFVRALKSKDNAMVNRAGAALRELGPRTAVAALVDALVTKHTFVPTLTAAGEQTYTFSGSGAGGGGFSFGDNRPKPVKKDVRNPQVLSALVAITSENFGYNEARWQAWLAELAEDSRVDLRRDL